MNKKLLFILIAIGILLLIIFLSYFEMNRCEHNAIAAIDKNELEDSEYIILNRNMTNLGHDLYIYKSNINKNKIPRSKDYNRREYTTTIINEHIAQSLINPVNSLMDHIRNTHKSFSPINDMYSAITEGFNVLSVITLNNTLPGNIILERHKEDLVNAFFAKDIIYIIA